MRCNNCGWDNPDGNQNCEKCGAPLRNGATAQNFSMHSTIREDVPFGFKQEPKTVIEGTLIDTVPEAPHSVQKGNAYTGTEINGGTLNPYAGMGGFAYTPIARCILKPVIFPGEDIRYAPQPVNLKGDYTELNRQLVDPDNNTITSKVQAVLTQKDGKWYVQDQSAQKTTYVHAGEPIEIKSGDIILMGNRTFVFEQD